MYISTGGIRPKRCKQCWKTVSGELRKKQGHCQQHSIVSEGAYPHITLESWFRANSTMVPNSLPVALNSLVEGFPGMACKGTHQELPTGLTSVECPARSHLRHEHCEASCGGSFQGSPESVGPSVAPAITQGQKTKASASHAAVPTTFSSHRTLPKSHLSLYLSIYLSICLPLCMYIYI